MRTALRGIAITAALAFLGATALAGRVALDLDGTTWDFMVVTKFTGKARGLGKAKRKTTESLRLAFLPGNRFTTEIDGQPLVSGTYTRRSPTSRKIKATLDAASEAALKARYAQEVEDALAEEGLPVNVTLDELRKQKTKLVLKVNKKKRRVSARFTSVFRFTGSATGGGVLNAPSRLTVKVRGTSGTVPLGDVASVQ